MKRNMTAPGKSDDMTERKDMAEKKRPEKSGQISVSEIARHLRYASAEDILFFDELDSTNNKAKELAKAGAHHGTAVIAGRQTAGRGRLGRRFESPEGTGIYMTVILRPGPDLENSLFLTAAAGTAVCRSIRELTGADAGIKWVNDIYIDGRKVCGILAEAVTDGRTGELECVTVGIGINFNTPQDAFSEEVRDRGICSLYESREADIAREQLIARILDELLRICSTPSDRSFLEDYRRWSVILGKSVDLIRGGERKRVRVLDIGENGELLVMTSDGKREEISSGEISVRW